MKLEHKKKMDLSDFLHKSECGECGEPLLYGDVIKSEGVDSPSWTVGCDNCGTVYYATVSEIEVSKAI